MTIPSSTRHLSEVRRFVEQHAREAGLSEADVDKFRLAVDEACTNVIEHACKGDETYRITITINIKGPRVTMLIRDDGEAFDPEKYAPDRKSTRLNSSHVAISYAVFCLKKKT